MPNRIQKRRDRAWKPEGSKVLICDRSGRWGNPFRVGHEATSRAEAVEMFRRWLKGDLYYSKLGVAHRRQWILAHLEDLRGYAYLACWCPPDEPCHCDVYLEMLG